VTLKAWSFYPRDPRAFIVILLSHGKVLVSPCDSHRRLVRFHVLVYEEGYCPVIGWKTPVLLAKALYIVHFTGYLV